VAVTVEPSRRGLLAAVFGLVGLACHKPDKPDTELPTEQLGPHFRRLRKRIRKHVRDRERREAALALVERIDRQLRDIDRVLVDWRTDLALLPDDQREDRSVILQVTRRYSEQFGEVAREVGQLAWTLRRHITAAEWPLVFPDPSHANEPEGPC
jgi:hypothetical protein